MKFKFFLFFLMVFAINIQAQEDAWVFLSNKPNAQTQLANPISILTQKALDRKSNHNITLDERDAPVDESYITQIKAQTGITVMAKSKWFNALHVRGTQTNINALLNLSFVAQIDFADNNLNARISQFNNKFEEEGVLTDFTYGNTANQIQMFNGDALHIDDYTGINMTVAVIDAGFPNVDTMSAFQRLRDNNGLLGGYDFVDRTPDVHAYTGNSHGTLVLSDMAGFVQDQFVGTAPDANYYLFRTEDAGSENPIEESLWVEAAERADSLGVDVINTSLGYTTFDNPNYSYTPAQMDGNTAFITRGANIAFEKGMLLVTSAGNSGNGSWQVVSAPADALGVLSVGAVQANGNYASFSSQGSSAQPTQKPDVVAQGQASYVITSSDVISTANGTSFSSPILAGGIVCLWQALPSLSNAQIMQLVRESASQYNNPDNLLGYGIPDLQQAFTQGLSVVEFENTNLTLNIYPNPVASELHVEIPTANAQARVRLYNVLGKKVMETTVTPTNSKINIASLSKGLYLLNIEADGLSSTIKLLKQ